jgi:hypothetical protein
LNHPEGLPLFFPVLVLLAQLLLPPPLFRASTVCVLTLFYDSKLKNNMNLLGLLNADPISGSGRVGNTSAIGSATGYCLFSNIV